MVNHDQPNAYREGSDIIFRPSSFGGCVKSLAAALSGMEPGATPKNFIKAFQDGHDAEAGIIHETELEYGTLVEDQQITCEYRDGNYVWRGHPDGMLYLSDRTMVMDAKNLGASYARSFLNGGFANMAELGVKYATQALIYVYAMEADGFVVAVRAKEEDVVYFEEYDIKTLQQISGLNKRQMRKKAKVVEDAAINADLLSAPCDNEVFGCPFFYLHLGGDDVGLWQEDLGPVEEEIVMGLTRAKSKSDRLMAEAKAAKTASDQALKAWVERHQPTPEEIDGTDESKEAVAFNHETNDGFKITRFRGSSSKLDQRAMKEDGIDVDVYKTTSYFSQLKIIPPKEEE